jgi:hypothetical protein
MYGYCINRQSCIDSCRDGLEGPRALSLFEAVCALLFIHSHSLSPFRPTHDQFGLYIYASDVFDMPARLRRRDLIACLCGCLWHSFVCSSSLFVLHVCVVNRFILSNVRRSFHLLRSCVSVARSLLASLKSIACSSVIFFRSFDLVHRPCLLSPSNHQRLCCSLTTSSCGNDEGGRSRDCMHTTHAYYCIRRDCVQSLFFYLLHFRSNEQ